MNLELCHWSVNSYRENFVGELCVIFLCAALLPANAVAVFGTRGLKNPGKTLRVFCAAPSGGRHKGLENPAQRHFLNSLGELKMASRRTRKENSS